METLLGVPDRIFALGVFLISPAEWFAGILRTRLGLGDWGDLFCFAAYFALAVIAFREIGKRIPTGYGIAPRVIFWIVALAVTVPIGFATLVVAIFILGCMGGCDFR